MVTNKIVIISGLHGDEPAGNIVASRFKGKPNIIVLSLKNPYFKRRFMGKDLNRHFDTKDEGPIQKYIIRTIEKIKPKLVIDLHEDDKVKGLYVFCSKDLLFKLKKSLFNLKIKIARSVRGEKTDNGIIVNGYKRYKGTLEEAMNKRRIPVCTIETPSSIANLSDRVDCMKQIIDNIIKVDKEIL